jgi:hypothetical protein
LFITSAIVYAIDESWGAEGMNVIEGAVKVAQDRVVDIVYTRDGDVLVTGTGTAGEIGCCWRGRWGRRRCVAFIPLDLKCSCRSSLDILGDRCVL